MRYGEILVWLPPPLRPRIFGGVERPRRGGRGIRKGTRLRKHGLGTWQGGGRLLDNRGRRRHFDGGQGWGLDERPLGGDGGEPLLRRRRRHIRVRRVFPPQRRVERGAPSAVDQHEGARMACVQIKQ